MAEREPLLWCFVAQHVVQASKAKVEVSQGFALKYGMPTQAERIRPEAIQIIVFVSKVVGTERVVGKIPQGARKREQSLERFRRNLAGMERKPLDLRCPVLQILV